MAMHVFRHEVNARHNVQRTFWGMLFTSLGLLAFGWFLPRDEPWFRWLWIAFCIVLFGFTLTVVRPLIGQMPPGATFCVTLTEKHLQVESPHEHFGKSADIELDAIAELRTIVSGGDEHGHEIHCKSGEVVVLNHNAGFRPDLVFERILELRPEIAYRRGTTKEFTAKA